MMSLRTGQPLRQVNNDDIPNMICSKESKMEFCEFLGTLVNEGYNFDDIMGRVFPLVPSSNQNLRAQMDEGHRRWRKKFGGFYHGFTTRNGGAPQWAWSVCWGNGGAGALTDAQIEAVSGLLSLPR